MGVVSILLIMKEREEVCFQYLLHKRAEETQATGQFTFFIRSA